MSDVIQVLKRNKTLEDFNPVNIVRVAKAAGLSETEAEMLSAAVNTWLHSLGVSQVTSLQIRDKVLEELKKVNSNAADLFAWYETTKDPDTEPQSQH